MLRVWLQGAKYRTCCTVRHLFWNPNPFWNNAILTEEEQKKRLEALRIEHRDLDAAIAALSEAGSTDQLQIARLKKRKLRIRDQITILEDNLLPDIIA
jgi:hypothetical protein